MEASELSGGMFRCSERKILWMDMHPDIHILFQCKAFHAFGRKDGAELLLVIFQTNHDSGLVSAAEDVRNGSGKAVVRLHGFLQYLHLQRADHDTRLALLRELKPRKGS